MMAYDKNKLTKLAALEALAQRTKEEIGRTDKKVNDLGKRVDDLVTAGGEPNVITEVKLNGATLPVGADKSVNIEAATRKDVSDAVAAADHLKRKIVDSVDAIDLSAADAAQYIYMVLKDSGTSGDKYDEYMVIDNAVERMGDWAVDLSGFVRKEEGKGLSANDYTGEDKAKLAGLNIASDTEVEEMLAGVFGVAAAQE